MRRFLAILVLLILPLQMSFAVAAEYCDLSPKDAGQHFGHHTHKAEDSKKESTPKKSKAEKDCAFCHLGCAQLQISVVPSFSVPAASMPVVSESALPDGLVPAVFDRPPKHALA